MGNMVVYGKWVRMQFIDDHNDDDADEYVDDHAGFRVVCYWKIIEIICVNY